MYTEFRIPPSRLDGQTFRSACAAFFPCSADHTRALKFVETPEYAPWRDAFCGLAPRLSGYPLFDQDDNGLPHVGVSISPHLVLKAGTGDDSGHTFIPDDEVGISCRV